MGEMWNLTILTQFLTCSKVYLVCSYFTKPLLSIYLHDMPGMRAMSPATKKTNQQQDLYCSVNVHDNIHIFLSWQLHRKHFFFTHRMHFLHIFNIGKS